MSVTFGSPKDVSGTTLSKAHVTERPKGAPPNFGVESMMQWLYSQMRLSNKDVQETLQTVESSRDKLKALSELQQALRDNKTASFKDGEDSKTNIASGPIDWSSYKKTETVTVEGTGAPTAPDPFKPSWLPSPTGSEPKTETRVVLDEEKLAQEDWYQALSADGKAAVKTFLNECNTGDGKVMEKQVDKLLDAVKDEISALNSDNELQMINLQHVMQTRNQAIQLASNIISVLDRGADVAINNIGKG